MTPDKDSASKGYFLPPWGKSILAVTLIALATLLIAELGMQIFFPDPLGTGIYERLGKLFQAYAPSNMTGFVSQAAGQVGIPSLNLFPTFRDAHPENLFFKADGHWNDRGQDLAANQTAGFIFDRSLLS